MTEFKDKNHNSTSPKPEKASTSLLERYRNAKGRTDGFFSSLAQRIRKGGQRSVMAFTAAGLSVCCVAVLGITLFSGGSAQGHSDPSALSASARAAEAPPSAQSGEAMSAQSVLPEASPALSEFIPTPTPIPTPGPTPVFSLSYGDTDAKVAELQTRLMELGYMDEDEATEYYGSMTRAAVRLFERQLGLEESGVITQELWDQLMSEEAPHYTVMLGMKGDDVKELQNRLYEMGYLPHSSEVTGYFGEITEAAVKKMQELNKLRADGKAGTATIDLLYSSEVVPNYYSYGEESETILTYQKKLKELGYMTTTPDGKYGQDTMAAIKQFQSRNDLVADGYLGPSTIKALNSSSATPNALSIGTSGDTVQNMQKLLYKYNYIKQSAITGYYGTITEAAVKLFQKNNGLSQDGQVGKKTMNVLTGDSVVKASSPVTSGSSGSSSKSSKVQKLLDMARSKLGSKYVRGAKGPSKFDCSGFVYWCLNQVGIKQSYLTSYGWRTVGKYTKITDFSKIRAGDIVVVKGHMGIASSSSKIIDASSSNGKVVERSFQSNWWKRNFVCAWRIYD